MFFAILFAASLAVFTCDEYVDPGPSTNAAEVRDATPFPVFGGAGGRQYSDSGLITRDNVRDLKPVWSYHTGEASIETATTPATAFQVTPILVDGILYFCTPYNRVVALDPATGAEFWAHDPHIRLTAYYGSKVACRGVTFWRDSKGEKSDQCSTRIFTATADARLIALDAKTGELCGDFGQAGEINLAKGVGSALWPGEIQNTSPPLIIGDKVVVGGAIGDNQRVHTPSGVVRAFDARTGVLVWAQDMAPPGYDYELSGASDAGYALGSPNVWAPMVADEALGLVYAPTGNPSPDYYRNGDRAIDYYGSSLVALDGDTGDIVWHYQFVHRDFWDYDTPAQPTLFELERDGEKIPAVAQATKMGFVFILDRRTGESLFPVEERAVPQDTDVPLDLSPTQPFPVLPKPVAQVTFDPEADIAWGCDEKLEDIRYDGLYTPPSTDWTLMLPGNGGGPNWGGLSIDPERQILVIDASNMASRVKLIPRDEFDAVKAANPGKEISPQSGTPYGMWREFIESSFGFCTPFPWGTLTGIDLRTGEQIWQSTLGTLRDILPVPLSIKTGMPVTGGPLTTRSGLTFIGAAGENYLRAFDTATGEEIWKGRLPAPAFATPMSYVVTDASGNQKQFVIVAAGGTGMDPTGLLDLSDTLVAFALEKQAGPWR